VILDERDRQAREIVHPPPALWRTDTTVAAAIPIGAT
jgi:hypothetical protein